MRGHHTATLNDKVVRQSDLSGAIVKIISYTIEPSVTVQGLASKESDVKRTASRAQAPTLLPVSNRQPDRPGGPSKSRLAITTKVLPPGARLTEAKLAEDLNVKQQRECARRSSSCAKSGLIEPDGRRGGRVVQRR